MASKLYLSFSTNSRILVRFCQKPSVCPQMSLFFFFFFYLILLKTWSWTWVHISLLFACISKIGVKDKWHMDSCVDCTTYKCIVSDSGED
ncbi:hypothetical protein ACOSQ3_026296 [Xanthoceras sorbifolium]